MGNKHHKSKSPSTPLVDNMIDGRKCKSYKIYSKNHGSKCIIMLKPQELYIRIKNTPTIRILYSDICNIDSLRMWPGISTFDDLLYLNTTHQGQHWFRGKNSTMIDAILKTKISTTK